MICKLIVAGDDRDSTRLGTIAALEQFEVEGIKSTIPIHLEILADARFSSGDYDTRLVGQMLGERAQAKA
jgi:acetyl-CoA carboxylase biotin carboxylase subunit